MIREAWVKVFLQVGGGVKGAPMKLEGGVIFCWSFRGARNVDIAVDYATSWAASRG